MEQIRDGRRYVLIHSDAEPEDLPVENLPDMPGIADAGSFTPANMGEPEIFPGDVVIGVRDENVEFAELVYGKTDDGVLILPLGRGYIDVIGDQAFSSRFFQVDEVHVFDGVVDEAEGQDVEFDTSQLERPETRRSR
ncbi:MAG: hypothetical protein BRD23_06700 [Halobacteriales archaeon SW_9_67_25]|jgi:hypothetical protein|nr:MAG: hypothetical protein BRD23_06700 [Halobacteriales archaeon SW_9_67_25]